MNKMKEGLIKDTYEVLIKEMQTVISISYILAIGIGMLFNFQKFSEFGINIFDYADVFDFLIAPFSDLKILLFTIISLTLAYIIFKLDLLFKRKFSKFYSKQSFGMDKKLWYKYFRYISIAILFILYLIISSDKYGKISKQQILNQSSITIRYSDNEIKKGKVIGKTKDVIFLLTGEKVEAIPITSLVKEIEIIK
ncbi:hypothetical protein ACFLSY_00800 [Bacteroidota bacterium]